VRPQPREIVAGSLTTADFAAVGRWIDLNQALIADAWDGSIDIDEVLQVWPACPKKSPRAEGVMCGAVRRRSNLIGGVLSRPRLLRFARNDSMCRTAGFMPCGSGTTGGELARRFHRATQQVYTARGD
jgi:hypothetical protein